MKDIKDSEIRIIGAKTPQKEPRKWWQHKRFWTVVCLALVIIGIIIGLVIGTSKTKERVAYEVAQEMLDMTEAEFEPIEEKFVYSEPTDQLFAKDTTLASYCEVRDTIINDIPLRIYYPQNAVPELHIGKINTGDQSIILAMQAADVRKDNGKIVGACVYKGEVESRGLSKRGYVSILGGQIEVGVADNSPLFEKAIEEGGDFFRQYPLVDNGNICESALKGKSVRRAICQRGEEILMVETQSDESMYDMAQVLQDFQVKNAVYLVGSQYACGFMRDKDKELITWGEFKYVRNKNISYIVWKKK